MSLDSEKKQTGGADTRIKWIYPSLLIFDWKALVENLRFTIKMVMMFNHR